MSDGTSHNDGLLNKVTEHPQTTGIAGVLIGCIGVVLLVSSANPVATLMAGYSFGLASAALVMQIMIEAELWPTQGTEPLVLTTHSHSETHSLRLN